MRLGNPHLAVDSKLEEDGKWVDMPTIWWRDKDTPMRVLIRGTQSKRQQALLRSLTKDLTKEEIDEKANELAAELAANLVAGFENWFDVDGNQIRYSVEVCRSIFLNRDNRRVLDFVNTTSNTLSTFDATKEEVEKN